jgi:hypothetical protein
MDILSLSQILLVEQKLTLVIFKNTTYIIKVCKIIW